MKLKICKSDIWVLCIVVLTFEKIISSFGMEFLGYGDEVFEMIMLLLVFVGIIKKRFTSTDIACLSLAFLFAIVGLLGNVFLKYQNDYKIITLDIIATFKGVLYFYGIKALDFSEEQIRNIISRTYSLYIYLIYIMIPCVILNLFVNIGMSHEKVYGIKGFTFLDTSEGNLALSLYPVIACVVCKLVIDARYTVRMKLETALVLIVWCATLRSRSFGFTILFVLMTYYMLGNNKRKVKLRLWQIATFAIALWLVAREKIEFYFGNTDTARFNLIKYGILNAKRFFPIGSGFGTYGSDMAMKNYSTLYSEYKFNNIYGLQEDGGKFANDGTWGELFGQFGFIGTIIFVLLFFVLFRRIYKSHINKYGKFAVLFIATIITLGSVGTKTVMNFAVTPVFIFLALLLKYNEIKRKKYKIKNSLENENKANA